jgi:methyl-accepting chemotaxis protein
VSTPGSDSESAKVVKYLGIFPKNIKDGDRLANTIYHVSLAQLLVVVILTVFAGLLGFISRNPQVWGLGFLALIGIVFTAIATWLSLLGKQDFSRHVLMLTTLLLLLSISLSRSAEYLVQFYLIWLIILSGLLFGRIGTLIMGAIVLLVAVLEVLVMGLWKVYVPPISFTSDVLPYAQITVLVSSLTLITIGITVLINNLNSALKSSEEERLKVSETGQKLAEQREKTEKLSISLKEISQGLAVASRQQASGALEQASAVNQVTTSMEELSQTARQISDNAEQVAVSVQNTLSIVKTSGVTTRDATLKSESGRDISHHSLQAIQKVQSSYDNLAHMLEELKEQSLYINNIMKLITDVSNQTHLLALNAAIESAGAGEYGNRFGVVAQEVKILAERTRVSASEVREVVGQIGIRINSAVQTAREGLNQAAEAVKLAHETGETFNNLSNAIEQLGVNTQDISVSAEINRQLVEEIQLATGQQRSASQQIVQTMHGVGTVAADATVAAERVAKNTSELDKLTEELRITLST